MEVPHCSLYDEGWHRIGCIGCPMSSSKQKQIENTRYPHVKRNWIKAIKAIRGGQNSLQATSDGTSKRIRNQSETSENCSGYRRLDCPSRPQTLARQQFYGGGELGSTNQTPTRRISGRQTEQDGHHSASTSTSTRTNYGVWNEAGFLKAHRLTA